MTQIVDEVSPTSTRREPALERFYYPQLDGLRFVAFLMVYIFHEGIPQFGGWVDAAARALFSTLSMGREWTRFPWGHVIRENGWVGVQLFFILSGYLITTLLLREEARFGRIDLRAFWVRRILRIWPLYYLILIPGFLILPWLDNLTESRDFWVMAGRQLPWFLTFLGNWSMGLIGPVWSNALSVLWSVCVEEQFYLFCPLLVGWVPSRWRVPLVLALMGVSVVGRWLMARAEVNPLLFQYSTITQLDTLLSGVLLALLLERFPPGEAASRWAGWLQWPLVAGSVWLLTRPNLAHGTLVQKVWEFVALWVIGAGLVALIVARSGWPQRLLSHRWLVWLGRISYGLYMYHEIAIWSGRRFLHKAPWFPNKEILTTVGTFLLTVAMAAVSYYAFERPFLALKKSWTRVPSRPV